MLRRLKPERLILTTACPKELLRKHAASDLLVSLDLCAESRCPTMDFSWRCPVEGPSGSDFLAVDSFQLRYSSLLLTHH